MTAAPDGSGAARRRVAVFGSSSTHPGSAQWADGERLGSELAARGWVVCTGGYGGTMEAVSAGAASAGGAVVGVTAPSLFPDRPGANRHVDHEIAAPTLLARIDRMLEGAAAAIALPGSLGTFTELVATWNVVYLARRLERPAPLLVTVGPAWRELVAAIETATGSPRTGIVDVPTVDDVLDALEASLGG